jgi:hypothetical protein
LERRAPHDEHQAELGSTVTPHWSQNMVHLLLKDFPGHGGFGSLDRMP